MVEIKSKEDIKRMRESGRIVALLLSYLKGFIAPGITTAELDRMAFDFIEKKKPSPLSRVTGDILRPYALR